MKNNILKFPFEISGRVKNYLYSKGKEFFLNGKEYIGEYHIIGSQVKTESIESDTSEKLEPFYEDQTLYTYDTLLLKPKKKEGCVFVKNFSDPLAYIVKTSESDYQQGYIYRYFAKNIIFDNQYIIEISPEAFGNAGNDSIGGTINDGTFLLAKIKWIIIGLKDDILKKNKETLLNLEDQMPGITITITNLLQFARLND